MATLESTVHSDNGRAVIRLAGDIDGTAEHALEGAWAQVAGTPHVLLHFGDVEYINSTGIALIVGLLARARTDRVEVSACGLSSHYREIFEITRLSDFMTIVADERAALGSRPGQPTHTDTEELGR
ncbi:MAG: STAS domain-containing protein [Solirubrobacterales bacterium]